MRKLTVTLALGSALALGACATNPYGSYGNSPYGGAYGGMGGPLEAILGSIASSSQGYYGGGNFQQAAINACAGAASRYGQVAIRDIRQTSRSTLRVYGIVGNGYRSDDFACSFRSDGRITDFDL
jgi:hypothetical protein